MNKTIRRWMVFLVCIAFVGQLLVGCSAKSQGAKTDRSDEKQLKIGFAIDTLVLERWTRDRDVFTAVAQELGISTTTLWRRMKKYGVINKYDLT